MKIIAQVGDVADSSKLPTPTDSILFVEFHDNKNTVLHDCGHKTLVLKKVNVYGLEYSRSYKTDKCAKCCKKELERICIRCAVCGLPIMPCDSVTTCHPGKKKYKKVASTVNGDYLSCIYRGRKMRKNLQKK